MDFDWTPEGKELLRKFTTKINNLGGAKVTARIIEHELTTVYKLPKVHNQNKNWTKSVWKENELRYLIKHIDDKTPKEIAQHLGVFTKRVWDKKYKLKKAM